MHVDHGGQVGQHVGFVQRTVVADVNSFRTCRVVPAAVEQRGNYVFFFFFLCQLFLIFVLVQYDRNELLCDAHVRARTHLEYEKNAMSCFSSIGQQPSHRPLGIIVAENGFSPGRENYYCFMCLRRVLRTSSVWLKYSNTSIRTRFFGSECFLNTFYQTCVF